MTTLAHVGTAELAVRIQPLSGASAFVAFVVPEASVESVTEEVADELRSLEPGGQTIVASGDGSASAFLVDVKAAPSGTLLLRGDHLDAEGWAQLDRRRSALERQGVTVVVMTEASFALLSRFAPNLASWFGGNVFALDAHAGETTPEQQAQRLGALRAWSGKADDEVVALAVARALPPDPEYAEWLVLLDRGDLLGDDRLPR